MHGCTDGDMTWGKVLRGCKTSLIYIYTHCYKGRMYDRCSSACIGSGRFTKFRSRAEELFSNPPCRLTAKRLSAHFPVPRGLSMACGEWPLRAPVQSTWLHRSVPKHLGGHVCDHEVHSGFRASRPFCLLCARITSDLNIAASVHTSPCACYLSCFITGIMPWLKLQRSGCCRRLHYWTGHQLCYPFVRHTILGSYSGQHASNRTLSY